jgi:hypothetical protein
MTVTRWQPPTEAGAVSGVTVHLADTTYVVRVSIGSRELIFSSEWRRRDSESRLAVWEPLIGREATITATRSLWVGKATTLFAFAWVVGFIAFQVATGKEQGAAYAAIFLSGFAVMVTGFVWTIRLFVLAQRRAALIAGTSAKARPPVTKLDAFRRWQGQSKYARRSQA